jgi:putative transposase
MSSVLTSTGSSTPKSLAAAQGGSAAFKRKWRRRCPGVVRSLAEGGEELLTFIQFPKNQWKTPRSSGGG